MRIRNQSCQVHMIVQNQVKGLVKFLR